MTVPEDFLRELAEDPKAEAFFRTLNRANTFLQHRMLGVAMG